MRFLKKNKAKLLALVFALGVFVAASVGVVDNVKAISEIRQAQAEQPKVETKVETLVIERTVEVAPPRVYFDVDLSKEVQDCIFDECEKHGLSPAIVVAMIERESRFKVEAVGDDGRSIGLMQIQTKWHLQRMAELHCENLLDPLQNVKVGIDYLAELKERNSNIFWQLMAYNGGASYANERIKSGNISTYATSVVARAYELGGGVQ